MKIEERESKTAEHMVLAASRIINKFIGKDSKIIDVLQETHLSLKEKIEKKLEPEIKKLIPTLKIMNLDGMEDYDKIPEEKIKNHKNDPKYEALSLAIIEKIATTFIYTHGLQVLLKAEIFGQRKMMPSPLFMEYKESMLVDLLANHQKEIQQIVTGFYDGDI